MVIWLEEKVDLYRRLKGQKVLLVLDNITEENREEVRDYIEVGLGENSCILLSAPSVDLLVNHLNVKRDSCMRVPRLEEDEAIGILLGSTSAEVSNLGPEEFFLALNCAKRCLFSVDGDREGRTFHPLALKAFGSQHGHNLSKLAAKVDGEEDTSENGLDGVFSVLREAFDDMSPMYRTIFMLLTVYLLPDMPPQEVTEWLAIIYQEEIPSIKKAVEGLRNKAFIEQFEPEIRIHNLYTEFAENTANKMERWLCWKGDKRSTRALISKDQAGFELVKLEQCRSRDPSQIPHEQVKNLRLLQLLGVNDMSNLDFNWMHGLRSLILQNCGQEELGGIENLVQLGGMEKLEQLGWFQISKVNLTSELPMLSVLKGLQRLEIDIVGKLALGDLTSCRLLREINVRCPSLLVFPTLKGLRLLEKVEFRECGEVTEALDCTNCVMLIRIVLNGCRKMAAPPVLAGLKKLEIIVLLDCDAVTECPEIDEPSALNTFELSISSQTASVPRSLENCDRMENLQLWKMEKLTKLPSFIRLSNLTMLKIGKCGIREPPDLTCCLKLENVYFFTLKNLESFPDFSKLSELKILNLYNCSRVRDPPDIRGCHKLKVFHLVCNDNLGGLPLIHELTELDEIKVSCRGPEDEVTYELIEPDKCKVDDDFQSCLRHFEDEIPVEDTCECVPIELREWLSTQQEIWIFGRTMLVKKYFRGVKLYYSFMAAYESYESSNYYSKNYITLRLVDGKVVAFPTPGLDCKDRGWLYKVRQYFARKKDFARGSAVSGSENVHQYGALRYNVSAMQGGDRMCEELKIFFDKVQPNEKEIRIAGLYGMPGAGKSTLAKAFCNRHVDNYDGKVFYIEFREGNALDTQKLALQNLTRSCTKSQFEWEIGEENVRYVFCSLVEGQKVLLVLDNTTEDRIGEVREYLEAGLGKGSCIVLIARSENVLLNNNFNIKYESRMAVPSLTEDEALAILLERASALQQEDRGRALDRATTCLSEEDRRHALDCANSCLFNPLALKAFGGHCFAKHSSDLSKWAAEINGLARYFSKLHSILCDNVLHVLHVLHVTAFDVVGMAFDGMDAKSRSIFMLLTQLMPPKFSSNNKIIEELAEICQKEVEDLHSNGFIEEIKPEIRTTYFMGEFAEKLQLLQKWRNRSLPPMYYNGLGEHMCQVTEEKAMVKLLEKASLEKSTLHRFCQYALGITTISGDSHPDKEMVQAECGNLPPAVHEIVNSVYGRSSEGECSSDYHNEGLLNRLKESMAGLDDVEKQYFSEVAAFSQRESIPANALLDIWVYVRGMTRYNAALLLLKIAARHLLHLRADIRLPSIRDDCLNNYIFAQDDVQRKLALFMAELYNVMYVSASQTDLCPNRETLFNSEAQIVSFHTGATTHREGGPQRDFQFPEAEALILYFSSSECCIPRFVFKMEKLKVLIIRGCSCLLTGLYNFEVFSQLKTLNLEFLEVSSLLENCRGLKSLEKIRLSQCEGLGRDTMFELPGLLECYVDYCYDVEEFPAGICSSKFLEVLSITRCRRLEKIPDELDKVGSLKEIRLCGCYSLKALPPFIGKLPKLEILDISNWFGLTELIKGDYVMKETLQKLAKLPSLECVICDKRFKQLFQSSFRPGLFKVATSFDLEGSDFLRLHKVW